jgi:hypothetical protein
MITVGIREFDLRGKAFNPFGSCRGVGGNSRAA